ncbi:MAG: plasmid pRiA4b ORF-3 family protein [Candidatus Marinimicrobia bacterium]|nr:plasmid pRiA4b ORF-3 family protein [Candidatus Neomarinimicrobiota bacterium]
MVNKVYQIHVLLKNSKPRIWRRVIISSITLLSDLHKIIQTVMGWGNGHLNQFIKDGIYYSLPYGDEWFEFDSIDYTGKRINELLLNEGDKLIYEYDFGDRWEHEIRLEQILHPETPLKHPVCIKGKRNCPPEDCGGVWGYADMLEILDNPQHKQYEDVIEWSGGEFDPDYFNLDEISEMLKEDDFGCFDFDD